jgi:hypothetical protein
LILLACLSPVLVLGQEPFGTPTTPDAQRNALSSVHSQVDWLQNGTRSASRSSTGVGNLWQQFQALRGAYTAFTQTLNSQQLAQGANDLAELSAGLNIIQEAFSNYQQAVDAGQQASFALRDLSQILREASQIWVRELDTHCARLRVGRH